MLHNQPIPCSRSALRAQPRAQVLPTGLIRNLAQFRLLRVPGWLSAVFLSLSFAGSAYANDLPRLETGHTDVGINYEDGNWDLHVHSESLEQEFAPEEVWLKVASSARTAVSTNSAFHFLGAPGSAVWMLPSSHRDDLLFLGLGTEEMAEGLFQKNQVNLALKSVEGPGFFSAYQLDAFGAPIILFNSRDGLDANDSRALTTGGHAHLNWVFTAPGQYRIGLQASGVLAATGETTTSEVAYYHFEVGALPRLDLVREQKADHLRLEWQSETNTLCQVQYRAEAGSGSWTNLGPPIAGNGQKLEERIETKPAHQLFRLSITYNGTP